MKKLSLMVLAFGLLSSPSYANAGTEESIKAFCAEKWGTDYSMQKYCIEKQGKAFNNVFDFKEKKVGAGGNPDNPYAQILVKCMEKWKATAETYDWSMVDYCIEKQSSAYDEINR